MVYTFEWQQQQHYPEDNALCPQTDSSCKFHSCARYLDMYVQCVQLKTTVQKMRVCSLYLCIWVCVYLWHIWLVYMYGPALYLFHNGVLLIYIYFLYVWYIQAFWPRLKVRIVLYFAHVNEVRNRGYYMAAQGYEFYLRVLKVSLMSERSEQVRDTFSTSR